MIFVAVKLFERMCMALGGRAAESVIFNHVTTGKRFAALEAREDVKKTCSLHPVSAVLNPDNSIEF